MARAINYPMGVPQGLSAAIVDEHIAFLLKPMANVVDWEYRFSTTKDPSNEPWFPATQQGGPDDATGIFPDNTTIYLQLRPINAAGLRGCPSSVASLTTPEIVDIAFKDFKKIGPAHVTGATQPDDISLATMTNPGSVGQVRTGLDFAAGDLIVIFAFGYSVVDVGTNFITQGTATGWTELLFTAATSGTNTGAVRALMKVAAGGEDVVDVLAFSGGTSGIARRQQYYAVSYTIVGTPAAYGSPTAQITLFDPSPQQAIQSGFSVNPIIAFSIAGAMSASPINFTFTGATPDIDEPLDGGAPAPFASRLKLVAFGVDSVFSNITADLADLGHVNVLGSGAIEIAEDV